MDGNKTKNNEVKEQITDTQMDYNKTNNEEVKERNQIDFSDETNLDEGMNKIELPKYNLICILV